MGTQARETDKAAGSHGKETMTGAKVNSDMKVSCTTSIGAAVVKRNSAVAFTLDVKEKSLGKDPNLAITSAVFKEEFRAPGAGVKPIVAVSYSQSISDETVSESAEVEIGLDAGVSVGEFEFSLGQISGFVAYDFAGGSWSGGFRLQAFNFVSETNCTRVATERVQFSAATQLNEADRVGITGSMRLAAEGASALRCESIRGGEAPHRFSALRVDLP